MRIKLLTLLGAVLFAASTAQAAAAARPHRSKMTHQALAKTHVQWRDSNAYAPAYVPLVRQPDVSSYDEALSPPAGH
jgi:hypothetical protein